MKSKWLSALPRMRWRDLPQGGRRTLSGLPGPARELETRKYKVSNTHELD